MTNAKELTAALKDVLTQAGAVLSGCADMSGVEGCSYPRAAAVAIPLPVHIIEGIEDGPTKEYYDMYYELNDRLNGVVRAGEQFLTKEGFRAFAQTTDVVKTDENWRSPLPHKTVATRAGLGWIGKSCLLVTPEYGSGLRLSSLLTDAPLTCAQPVTESRCGACTECVKACPAQALKGTLWQAGLDRREIFAREICKKKQLELMLARTGISQDLCGKCFVVCPYTRARVKRFHDRGEQA